MSADVVSMSEGEVDIVLNCTFAGPPSTATQHHHWYHHNKWLYASDNPMTLVENNQLLERWKYVYEFSYTAYSGYSTSYLVIKKGMLTF